MTLNILIVIIGSVSYFFVYNINKSIVEKQNLSSIELGQNLMELRMEDTKKLATDIYLNIQFGELAEKENFDDSNARYLVSKLINVINYGVSADSIVSNAFVYLWKSDCIISNEGLYDARFYYDNYIPEADMSFLEWKQSLLVYRAPTFQNAVFTFSNYNTESTRYIHPFNIYAPEVYGCIVINYRTERLEAILQSGEFVKNGGVELYYKNSLTPLISCGKYALSDYLDINKLPIGKQREKKTPYGEVILIKNVTSDQQWTYIYAIPIATYYSGTNILLRIMIVITMVQIISGGVLAMFFSWKSYRPIHGMIQKIKDLGMDYKYNPNEMEYIQAVVTKTISDSNEMRNQLKMTHPLVIKSLIIRLLQGNISEFDHMYKYKNMVLELFSERGFICVEIHVEDCSEFIQENTIEEMQLVKSVLINVMDEVFNQWISAICLDYSYNTVVLVLNISYDFAIEKQKEIFEKIETQLKLCQVQFEENFKIYTSAGVSQLKEGIRNLFICHKQAHQALNQNIASGLYGINEYSEASEALYEYSYKLQDEIYLINVVKTGNWDQTEIILKDIVNEYASAFLHSSVITQCFYVDLVGTLLRIIGELNIPVNEINIEVSKLLSAGSFGHIKKELFASYKVLCLWINQNKKSHNTEMKDKIEKYIQDNYMDNSLSLVSLADYMKLNPAYMSTLIKEQLGDTFLSYVLDLRMEKAKQLLDETDMSQQEIALAIGYANSGGFIKVFKKKYGCTPGVYRNQAKF